MPGLCASVGLCFVIRIELDDAFLHELEGEIGDGHQYQLARELDGRGLARVTEADEIDVADLMSTMSTVVRRVAVPPRFELVR